MEFTFRGLGYPVEMDPEDPVITASDREQVRISGSRTIFKFTLFFCP